MSDAAPLDLELRRPDSGESPIVSNLGHATFGLWFPVFRLLASRLPPEWLARLGAATVERAIWARENVREAILGNVASVLGRPVTDRAVEETALSMLSRHSRLWIDLLRLADRPPARPSELVSRNVGTEHLIAARAAGRGALLITAHVGNFEIGGMFLRDLDLDVAVVYIPDPSPVVEAHRARARERLGVAAIPVATPLSFVAVLRALERNVFVAIQGDRDYAGTGKRLPFLGKSASFPVGPFKLAAASGAPLLPVFVLQEDDGRYRTVVEAPIHVEEPPRRSERDAALEAAMLKFVAVLERTVRENPSQWYCFTRFWETMG